MPEVFCKKVFLEVSQNSQGSNCARVSFLIKLQSSEDLQASETLRDSGTGVFLWILWNFIEHLWWLLLIIFLWRIFTRIKQNRRENMGQRKSMCLMTGILVLSTQDFVEFIYLIFSFNPVHVLFLCDISF